MISIIELRFKVPLYLYYKFISHYFSLLTSMSLCETAYPEKLFNDLLDMSLLALGLMMINIFLMIGYIRFSMSVV